MIRTDLFNQVARLESFESESSKLEPAEKVAGVADDVKKSKCFQFGALGHLTIFFRAFIIEISPLSLINSLIESENQFKSLIAVFCLCITL